MFIPCILLQSWSVLLRINEYGVTPSRYFGVALVIFELIYMALYLVQRLFKKEAIALILWVGAFAVIATLVLPFSNYASVCVCSQINRLSGIKIDESLKSSELCALAGSSYQVLMDDCGYRGRETVQQVFSENEREILGSCSAESYSGSRTYYLNDRTDLADFDISGYKTLTVVEGKGVSPEASFIELSSNGQTAYTADLSKLRHDRIRIM